MFALPMVAKLELQLLRLIKGIDPKSCIACYLHLLLGAGRVLSNSIITLTTREHQCGRVDSGKDTYGKLDLGPRMFPPVLIWGLPFVYCSWRQRAPFPPAQLINPSVCISRFSLLLEDHNLLKGARLGHANGNTSMTHRSLLGSISNLPFNFVASIPTIAGQWPET